MDRLALSWNVPGGQVGLEVEFSLWTGWHCLGISLVDRLALPLNFPGGQVGSEAEFSLWAG